MTSKESPYADPILLAHYDVQTGKVSQIEQRTIPKLDDVWLTSPERTHEEVGAVLEGRLRGIELSLLNKGIESPIAETLGVKEELSAPQARLMAYAVIIDQYHSEHSPSTSNLEMEQKMEEEILIIKERGGNPKAVQRKIEKTKARWQAKMVPDRAVEQNRIQERIRERYIQKLADEMFTPDLDSIIHISRIPEVVESLSDKGSDGTRSRVNQLFESVSDYLATTENTSHFVRHQYKVSRGIVTRDEDLQVLSPVLQYILDETTLQFVDGSSADAIRDMSGSYLTFLRNRMVHLSKVKGVVDYPILTHMYDLATAGLASENATVIRDLDALIQNESGSMTKSNTFNNERNTFLNRFRDMNAQLVDWALENPGRYNTFVGSLNNLTTLGVPQIIRQFVLSDESRIYSGFNYLTKDLSSKYAESMRCLKSVGDDITTKHQRKMKIKYRTSVQQRVLNTLQVTHVLAPILEEESDHITLQAVMARAFPSVPLEEMIEAETLPNGLLAEQVTMLRQIFSATDIGGSLRAISRITDASEGASLEALDYYATALWGQQEVRELVAVENTNRLLEKYISDRSKWFVSLRGDQFSKERDRELEDMGIESLRFDIDRNRPREHKVSIRFIGFKRDTVLWLDKECKLYSDSYDVSRLRIESKKMIRNVLLKRLYVITSGQLSQAQEPEVTGVGVERQWSMYKRAHYRFFKPGGRHYRESHADLIMEHYGINLKEENIRRQKLGVLKPNQYMTFVSGSAPSEVPEGYETTPNELPFESAWIPSNRELSKLEMIED